MKKLSLMVALCWVVLYVWSAPRTQSQILKIASSLLSSTLPTAKSTLTLEQAIGASQLLTRAKSTADIGEPFYVFTVETLPAALYIVRLYSANRVYSTKFIKQ